MSQFDPRTLLRPELANLEEYTPILPFEVLSKRLGIPIDGIVKLDANENPYGPLPAVLEALAEYNYYHIYPDPQQTELREALAGYVGVPAEHILPTHGADEMLDYLGRLLLVPGDAIIDCPPTFGMYSFDAQLEGARGGRGLAQAGLCRGRARDRRGRRQGPVQPGRRPRSSF